MAEPGCYSDHLYTQRLSVDSIRELEEITRQIKSDDLCNVLTARLPGYPPAKLDMWNNQGLTDQIPHILKELHHSKASVAAYDDGIQLTSSRKINRLSTELMALLDFTRFPEQSQPSF